MVSPSTPAAGGDHLSLLQQEYERVWERMAEAQKEERMLAQRLQQAQSQSSPDAMSSSQLRRHSAMAPSYSHHGGRNGRPDSSRRATVGTASFSQPNLGATLSRPDKMMRSHSNQAAPTHSLARSTSMTSENSSSPSMAANGNGLGARRFGGPSTGMLSSLYQDEPANAQMLRRSAGRLPDVREDSLVDVGVNPIDYLKNMAMDDGSALLANGAPTQYFFANDMSYDSIPTMCSSQVPSLVSGGESIATANAQPLSRQNSSVDGSIRHGLALQRLDSNMSTSMERMSSNDLYGYPMVPNATKECFTSQDLLGIGGGLAPPAESAEMSRTISNMSSGSNSSTRSTASHQERRAKEARERQIQNSLRNTIAPRPAESDNSSPSSSASSSKKDSKVPLTKTCYRRPRHPRVHCNKCNDHPEGFRGQHELARHVSAKHSSVVIKWICRDPHTVGIASDLKAVNPLNRCKACNSKKQYGAYYNAAAHLRRTHFRPKPTRSKSKRDGKEERRAGNGGGDYPPMNELKHWMVRVQVQDGNVSAAADDDTPMVDDENASTVVMDFDDYGAGMDPTYNLLGLVGDPTSPYSSIVSSTPQDFDPSSLEYPPVGEEYPLMFET